MLKLGAKKAVFETLTLAQMIRHNFATKKPQFNGIGAFIELAMTTWAASPLAGRTLQTPHQCSTNRTGNRPNVQTEDKDYLNGDRNG